MFRIVKSVRMISVAIMEFVEERGLDGVVVSCEKLNILKEFDILKK